MGKYDYTRKSGKVKLKHLEVDGAVINIRTGLRDRRGRKVTSVEILPDDHYAGEKPWRVIPGKHNTRIVQLKRIPRKKKSKKQKGLFDLTNIKC